MTQSNSQNTNEPQNNQPKDDGIHVDVSFKLDFDAEVSQTAQHLFQKLVQVGRVILPVLLTGCLTLPIHWWSKTPTASPTTTTTENQRS